MECVCGGWRGGGGAGRQRHRSKQQRFKRPERALWSHSPVLKGWGRGPAQTQNPFCPRFILQHLPFLFSQDGTGPCPLRARTDGWQILGNKGGGEPRGAGGGRCARWHCSPSIVLDPPKRCTHKPRLIQGGQGETDARSRTWMAL